MNLNVFCGEKGVDILIRGAYLIIAPHAAVWGSAPPRRRVTAGTVCCRSQSSALRPVAHGVGEERGRGVLRLGLQVRSWPALPDRTPDWNVLQ